MVYACREYTRYCRIKALLNVAGSLNLRCALSKTYERGIIACIYYGYGSSCGRFYLLQHKNQEGGGFQIGQS